MLERTRETILVVDTSAARAIAAPSFAPAPRVAVRRW
jgi:hypothetical protein